MHRFNIDELAQIRPQAFAARIKRIGVVNAWDEGDSASRSFAMIRSTGHIDENHKRELVPC